MRLFVEPGLPGGATPNKDYLDRLVFKLTTLLRAISTQVNNLSEGRIVAVTNAYTAAPTTGTWAQGDFVRNSSPSELGSSGSKYVITGWLCTVGGTPGTWFACRTLTGN